MYRSHTCGELRNSHVGQSVTLSGWVQTVRKFGSITFIDLRDRYGITQALFDNQLNQQLEANPVGREFVIRITGVVMERTSKNPRLPTGDIEIDVKSYDILNAAQTPPFTIEDETDGGDELRMKYRYLDIRRPHLKDVRDFVVPSRMNQGQFYALPQSPQTFKQLLMVSGYDKYYQVVKCFRDEDLRADRQPEFTQIDCEMSFVEQEDVLNIFEGLFKQVFREIKGVEITGSFPRLTWEEAMWRYGNDKPDLRFGMQICNFKTPINNTTFAFGNYKDGQAFKVFDDAETILAIAVPGCSEYSRKQTDEIIEWLKRPQIGMNGMVFVKCNADGSYKSSADKFFAEETLLGMAQACGAATGDLILILAGAENRTRKAMSELRLEMGNRLGLRDHSVYKPLWVVDFPLFDYDEEENRYVACHHPFTSPKPEHIEWMQDTSKYAAIKANAYDMVLNGTEIGGGSIRIHSRDLQEKMFAALGMTPDEAQEKFGFLLGAFEYGAPLCALLGGQETIRDFIAFPKNNAGRDVMLDAPSAIDDKQKKELGL